jgi:hypothetical protein
MELRLREEEFKLVSHRSFKQKADRSDVEGRGQEEKDGVIIVESRDYCKI